MNNGLFYYLRPGNASQGGGGLLSWDGRSDAFELVGDFPSNGTKERAGLYGVDDAGGRVIIKKNDGELLYDIRTGATEELQLPDALRGVSLRSRKIGRRLIITGKTGPNSSMEYALFGNTLLPTTYTLPDGRLLRQTPGDVRFTLRDRRGILRLDERSAQIAGSHYGLVREEGDKFVIEDIAPLFAAGDGVPTIFPRYVDEDYFYAESPLRSGSSSDYVVWSATGEKIGVYAAASAGSVEGVTERYIFIELPEDAAGRAHRFEVYDRAGGGLVKTLAFDQPTPADFTRSARAVNDRLLFTTDQPATGREYYVADVELSAVTLLADVFPGAAQGINTVTTATIGDRLFFTANNGTAGSELYVTDGTASGTRLFADLRPGAGSSHPEAFFVHESTLYFTANGPSGHELYRVSAGDDEPKLVVDLNGGPAGSFPYDYAADERNLYFMADPDGDGRADLFALPFQLVGTDDRMIASPARIYPNPIGENTLTIEAPAGERIDRVVVYDGTGREVLRRRGGGAATLRLEAARSLPAGSYWVRTAYVSGRVGVNGVVR